MINGEQKKLTAACKTVAIVSLTLIIGATVFLAGCRFNIWSGPAEVYLAFGRLRQILGDKKGAIDDYTKSILVKKNSLALRWRGVLRFEGKDKQAAIKDLTQSIDLNPHSGYAYPYAFRGSARAATGNQQGAVQDFDQAIMLDPKNARNYELRAKSRAELRDFKGAIADLDHAIKLDPRDAWSYSARGFWLDKTGDKSDAMKDFDRSIQLSPNYAWPYGGRGKLRLDFGDAKGAIADLDEAIQLEPGNAWTHFNRGNARLACGDSKGALEDFECAARLDPKHSAYYAHGYNFNEIGGRTAFKNLQIEDNKSNKQLSATDLAHGERQVKAMLGDRPQMAKCVSAGDSVWKWTARQFAGESIGAKIFWQKQPPSDEHFLSDYRYPHRSTPGWIRVRDADKDGKPLGGEEVWSGTVFELYNIRGGPQSIKIDEEASSGKLTREEYVRASACVEFQAELRHRIFYRTIWLPQALQHNYSATDSYWRVNGPDTEQDWFAQFKDRSSYPFHCYGLSYDQLIANKVKDHRR